MERFNLKSKFKPTGDQPTAIAKLVAGLGKHYRDQTLLGVTGSGKTFTMANVIAKTQRPALIISHNKTLAAQLASEFREFFPDNAVHYFVSYYDYYQPEAYMPRTDTYIEKESEINEEIDRLRHASTQSLLSRRDVIVVASVSCIYGLGSPTEYLKERITLKVGDVIRRSSLLTKLNQLQFSRNDIDFHRGTYRVRGEVVDVFPADSENDAVRLTFDGDRVESISEFDSITGHGQRTRPQIDFFPATHYVAPPESLQTIAAQIQGDLVKRLAELKAADKLLEAQRLEQRTRYDLEMIKEVGYCTGIENYSRYFDGRKAGEPPFTLMDYFPKDFLCFVDESHMTLPQIRGMYAGDRSRKNTLVEYGFRLPAAYDNRPLQFPEFDAKINQVIYVSATPSQDEIKKSKQVAEQLIRPTGLLDPTVEIKPTKNQVDDLVERIRERIKDGERVLVTTLTKRMSEDLTEYLKELEIKVQYLHSDVETFERLEILQSLRKGEVDVVVGINLLREGLDLPEVSLIAILDADKEGFLRSDTALIQTMGRAARHIRGHVIMYADRITGSMKRAIGETVRRRKMQETYNKAHGITPQTIVKAIREERLAGAKRAESEVPKVDAHDLPAEEVERLLKEFHSHMELASKNMEFEKAALYRDRIVELRKATPQKTTKRRR